MVITQLSKKGRTSLRLCVLSLVLATAQAGAAGPVAPTREDVESALKSRWNKTATQSTPRSELTLHSVKFGKASAATAMQYGVDGIPKGGMVTPAIIDFTVRTYYGNETQAEHRVREAFVYKDKMDEWAVMTGSPKGQDTTTKEPALK
jgi:hypothetical protein